MAGPTQGTCGPWTTTAMIESCCSGLDPDVDPTILEDALDAATNILFRLSGKRWPGECERTVRPCQGSGCGCGSDEWTPWGSWSFWYWDALSGNVWSAFPVEVGSFWPLCGGCGNRCELPRVALPGPVVSVDEVVIDGEILDASAYKVWNYTELVRVDGEHWPCFPAGTLVWTSTGLKPIEAIEAGERVLTHKGRWRTVLRAGQTGVSELVELKGRGGTLRCTPDHPVWSAEVSKVDGRTKLGAPEWRAASEMVGTAWAMPTEVEALPPVLPAGFLVETQMPEFWWMLGRWLGDGWTAGSAGSGWSVYICCGKHETEDLRSALSTLRWRWRESEERTSSRMRFANRELWSWLREQFGTRAHNKRLPAWVFGLPEEFRRALLDGYVSADGSESRLASGATLVQLATVSDELALGVSMLAASLGLAPTRYRYAQRNDVIEGRKVNTRPASRVHFSRFDGVQLKAQRAQSWRDDDGHLWGRVKSATILPHPVPVYDLEVEEDHSFVADGFVVHNCTNDMSKDASAGSSDAEHTWQVTYTYGALPDVGGQRAAAIFACELAKLWCGASDCQLTPFVRELDREGISLSVNDPASWVKEGKVGIYTVDAWLNSVNPARLQRPSRVYRMGEHRRGYRSFTWP